VVTSLVTHKLVPAWGSREPALNAGLGNEAPAFNASVGSEAMG